MIVERKISFALLFHVMLSFGFTLGRGYDGQPPSYFVDSFRLATSSPVHHSDEGQD